MRKFFDDAEFDTAWIDSSDADSQKKLLGGEHLRVGDIEHLKQFNSWKAGEKTRFLAKATGKERAIFIRLLRCL